MANTYLTRTFSTTGDRQKFTLSMWVKRGIVPVGNQSGTEGFLFQAYGDSGNQDQIWLQSNGTINYVRNNANAVTPSQMLRDPNAWYHLVFAGDTTQGSNADRLKVYVNGIQAPIGQQDTITQNSNFGAINNAQLYIFGKRNSNDWYFDGSMSHIHLIDGTAYDATAFGSTDANGVWTINTSPSVTYGTNGFFILKDGNSVTDQSGNSNNFTVGGGTLTKTEDNPSNVFSTMNPLIPGQTNYTYSNGNNTVTQGSSAWVKSNSTLGMSSGKYYWEAKYVSGLYTVVGVDKTDTATPYPSTSSSAVGWKRNGNVEVATTPQTDIASYAHGDIVSVALDMDNGCVYFGKAGVWQNSGDPTSGSSKTGAYSLPSYVANTPYFATVSPYGSGATSMNFGNGYFGTTAVSSAGTNASGIGIFEYDVPTGYTALSTKGLNL
jgi:hypothetical protein